jgi:AcrR family transcriptional regulator
LSADDLKHEYAAVPTRRPGRPRSAQADRAILKAAMELLVEDGFEGMSMEGIAARAGVGKTTIYRRWSSKEEVMAAALRRLDEHVAIPDTGRAREDVEGLVAEFVRSAQESVVWPALRRIIGTAVGSPELLEIFWGNVIGPRQAALRTILERGVARGELRADLDIALAVDTLAGAIMFQVLFRPRAGAPLTPELAHRIVEGLWRGFALRAGSETSPRPPGGPAALGPPPTPR